MRHIPVQLLEQHNYINCWRARGPWNIMECELWLFYTKYTRHCSPKKPDRTEKRHIVSVISRIYDSLWYLSPVVVRFKTFLQELCESKIGWDQPLTGELLSKWKILISGSQGAYQITIPRYILEGILQKEEAYKLQVFCDASNKAYGAVVWPTDNDLHWKSYKICCIYNSSSSPL